MRLNDVRAKALLTLHTHGAMRPLEIVRCMGCGRRYLGAILGWAVWCGLVQRHGRRYVILPSGLDWLKQQGLLPRSIPPPSGPRRVFVC